jgi:acetyl esterase/lipase
MHRLLFFSLLAGSPLLAGGGPTLEKDIIFLEEGRAEKMDAYLPAAEFPRPLPAILMIHGGGWRQGDKAEKRTAEICSTLAQKGFAVFSANYLLNVGYRDEQNKLHLTEVAWPQNLHDCKSALRFLRKEATRFGIDPARIGVMGTSAGGHLAMLLAATADEAEFNQHGLYTEQSNAVSCVISLFGIADLQGKRLTPFTGSKYSPSERAVLEKAASPVTYLKSTTAPFFLAHGTADKVIPVEESRTLAGYLKNLGIEHRYVELPEAPHSFTLNSHGDLWPDLQPFLEKHLKAASPGL